VAALQVSSSSPRQGEVEGKSIWTAGKEECSPFSGDIKINDFSLILKC
jgi:hypothetical protein